VALDTLKLQMAALTNKGRVREQNEDALYFDERDRVIIVCDGMGGHAGGHIASELAVQVVSSGLRQLKLLDSVDETSVIEMMKNAVFGANDHILSRARLDASISDMGTTLVACVFMRDRVITTNVGDSRIYRIAGGVIEQVSQDHSLVAERVRAGQLDPNSDEASLLSNIVTRALGMEQVTIDITVEDLVPGDTYLLCSDGLSDLVEEHEMLAIVDGALSLPQACMTMVDLANHRGGIDNITVALGRADG
jgi:serine/threonine protein phosphatase PrpC